MEIIAILTIKQLRGQILPPFLNTRNAIIGTKCSLVQSIAGYNLSDKYHNLSLGLIQPTLNHIEALGPHYTEKFQQLLQIDTYTNNHPQQTISF